MIVHVCIRHWVTDLMMSEAMWCSCCHASSAKLRIMQFPSSTHLTCSLSKVQVNSNRHGTFNESSWDCSSAFETVFISAGWSETFSSSVVSGCSSWLSLAVSFLLLLWCDQVFVVPVHCRLTEASDFCIVLYSIYRCGGWEDGITKNWRSNWNWTLCKNFNHLLSIPSRLPVAKSRPHSVQRRRADEGWAVASVSL